MESTDPIASLEMENVARSEGAGPGIVGRSPGWGTLLGRRLPMERPSRRLFLAVFGASILLLLVRLIGGAPPWFSGGPASPPGDAVHLGLELAGGLMLLFVASSFLARSLATRDATCSGLAALFATTGLLELLHAATAWRAAATIEPPGPIWSWTVARVWFALGLVLVLWLGPRRSAAGPSLLIGGILGGGLVSALLILPGLGDGTPDLLRPAAVIPRPWELLPFALLVGAGTFLLGPFHRRRPSPSSHGLIVAIVPITLAHLPASLGWLRPWDADFALAHHLKLLGAAALVAGVVIDGYVAHLRRLHAQERTATTESRLDESTAALEQIDRDLLREASERRRAEHSLKLVEKAVATMSLGATVTDPQGRILFVNAAEAAMHGYEVEELIGRPSSIFAPDGEKREVPPATRHGWEPWTRETLNVTRDGTSFPVRLVSDAVLDENGALLGLVTICEDLTERQRVRRMKNEFVTVVSHELRTPLTSLLASLSILRRDLDPPEREEMLDICDRNGERLLQLIDDLLDLQKLSVGKLSLRPEIHEIEPLLAEACARISTLATRRDIRVEVDASRRVEILADRRRLAQILDNLLSNAIKFSPSGSSVRLIARGDDRGRCRISVADAGPGIPESYLEELFEPFSQHDASPTRLTGGTGLGLHVVQRLTETMGGSIEVETSTEPGSSGTTFHLLLPGPAGGPESSART